jgi:transcription-repair coupling factor (superfamily II helicase)
MYKRVAGVETEGQLNDVRAELEDRYGAPPPAVRNLMDYATLKLLAVRVGVIGVDRKREQMSIKFRQNAVIDPARLAQFVSSRRGAQFSPDGTLKFLLKVSAAEEVLRNLRELLQDLAGEVPNEAPAQTTQ